jgi:regulator of sigma E protease
LERQDPIADGYSPTPASLSPEPKKSGGFSDLITVLIVVAALSLFLRYLDFVSLIKVVMGLSFIIFIHELGHFLVAKWCDVNVSHFSIGFGPVIPGCSFQWGETKYQICLLPLGGYVQMLGQVDGDESSDGSENDPRSYRNKSVGQRMAIISAGVIMNAILAFLCFIVVYRGAGKDRIAAIIAATDPGSPAFVDGMRTGMRFTQIGDIKDPYFDDLKALVMGSHAGDKIRMVAEYPGSPKPLDLTIEPRKTKDDANPVIGILPASSTRFAAPKDVDPTYKMPVDHLTPAASAQPPFAFNDVIVGTTDPSDPAKVTPLPDDPYKKEQKDFFEFLRRMQLLAGKEVVVRVKREAGEVDVKVPPAFRASIGASMQMGQIVAVRKGSAAEEKLQLPETGKKFLEGDLIESVEVTDADGKPLVFEKQSLDPERLPLQLKAWAEGLVKAGKIEPAPNVTLTLRRHRRGGGADFESIKVALPWDNSWAFDRALPTALASPLAIPELGLAYLVKTTVDHVDDPNGPLKPGDVIKNIKVTYKDPDGNDKTSKYPKREFGATEWAHAGYSQLQTAQKFDKIHLKIERNNAVHEIDIVPTFDESWPVVQRGWLLVYDLRKQKADTTLEAIELGFRDTLRIMRNILNGIRQMIVGRIDWEKHLGGPISIARIAYSFAGQDIWEFIFFLGMISVNLAVINFLPIPLLDGGHMVFLIYEKLRGKPASEGVRVAATYVGLAFIACLILLVSYLDIGRLL